ncbi:site-specific integrase [Gemmiger sp.]
MQEQALVLSLLNTGMRRAELAGLTWGDLNFKDCTVHVNKSLLVFKDFGYQHTTTKESNDRHIDVAPEYMEFMQRYREWWNTKKKLMGASWQRDMVKNKEDKRDSLMKLVGQEFVIIDDFGWPRNPDGYNKLVKRVAQKAGISDIHPHMFRHTFVSLLMSNPDIGIATVAAEAGHAQPSTTLAIYTRQYKKRRESIRSQLSSELYTKQRIAAALSKKQRNCDSLFMGREGFEPPLKRL